MKPYVSHDITMAEIFREEPDYARHLLDEVLKDGGSGELTVLLRQLLLAFPAPQDATRTLEQLYHTLGVTGLPNSLQTLLDVVPRMDSQLSLSERKGNPARAESSQVREPAAAA